MKFFFTWIACSILLLKSENGRASGPSQITFRTVAISGQQVPGASPGSTFGSFTTPFCDSTGATIFAASLNIGSGTVTGSNDFGIWSETSGVLGTTAREGSQAPGTSNGVNFTSFNPYVINNGKSVFSGYLAGSGVNPDNDYGIWYDNAGSVSLVARKGNQAPNTALGTLFGGNTNSLGGHVTLNQSGQVAFFATLKVGTGDATSSNDSGLWVGAASSLNVLAREGDQAPGATSGVRFGDFAGSLGDYDLAFNSQGQAAFFAKLQGTGVTTSNDTGIWAGTVGSMRLVAREGDQAPGLAAGAKFSVLNDPSINSANRVAFNSRLLIGSGGITGANDETIWSERSGTLSLIAQEGTHAPGTPNGINFLVLGYPQISASGKSAFYGAVAGVGVTTANDEGIWSEQSGTLSLLARDGDQAPGTNAGVFFNTFGDPSINSDAFSAFSALLSGSGVSSSNDLGLWAQNPTGELLKIVREGELFEVNPGDFRTISDIDFMDGGNNGQNGREGAFNDNFTLTFGLRFTNGTSGIFTATVPEPSTWAMIFCGAVGICVIAARRKRYATN